MVDDDVATGERIELVPDRLRSTPTYAEDIDRLDADHGGMLGWLAGHGFGVEDVGRLHDELLEA